jgi:hypothetical protein
VIRWFVALSAAALFAGGCERQTPAPGPDVVASLAGVDVHYAEFERYVELNLGESGGALSSEALSSLFDQFVTERLLVRSALELGVARPGDGAAQAVEALLAVEPAAPVTETAISAYYREHLDDFRLPEQIELRAIRTDERVAAERARREIVAGADFRAVARRLSVDPTAEQGGEQGALDRDSLPVELGDALFELKDGQLSEVVARPEGFHLFQVVRRVPQRVRALDEVRAEILRRLSGARADRAYARLVAEARSRYAVAVYDRNLPFVYRGAFAVSRPYENR